ncbi:hypothetical protein M885DRAFT_626216, partial [Pelagophyceae sp. CCMP2097]
MSLMLRSLDTQSDGRCFYRALLFLLLELGLVEAPPREVDVLKGRDKATLSYLMDWRQQIVRTVQEKRAALSEEEQIVFDEFICGDLFDGYFESTDQTRDVGAEGWFEVMLCDDTGKANVLVEAGTNYQVFAQEVARRHGIDIRVLSRGEVFDIASGSGTGAMAVLMQAEGHFTPNNWFHYDESKPPKEAAPLAPKTSGDESK